MAHVVEDVAEHLAIPVYEVVLLEGVQHDGDGPVEEPGQSALRVPGGERRRGHGTGFGEGLLA